MVRVCHAARLGSYGLNAVRVRTSARYHGYDAYFTFLWHNAFNNVLPDPSLGLGLACETTVGWHWTFSTSQVYTAESIRAAMLMIFNHRSA